MLTCSDTDSQANCDTEEAAHRRAQAHRPRPSSNCKGVNHVLRDDPSDSVANLAKHGAAFSTRWSTALDVFVGAMRPLIWRHDRRQDAGAHRRTAAPGRGHRQHSTRPMRSWPPPNGWPPRRRSTSPWPARTPTKRTKAQTPVQRTITIGNGGHRGLRTYVQLFTVIAPRQRREVRRRVQLDVRLRLRLRRGHRRQPRALRQPGDADGARPRRPTSRRARTGRRRRSPRGSTFSWPSAPASASGWRRRASRRSARRPGAATASRAPLSRCGTRTSS